MKSKKVKVLKNVYLILFGAVFISIVYYEFKYNSIQEILFSLFSILTAYLFYSLYKKEIKKNKLKFEILRQDRLLLESKIEEAFKYIGKLNVQVDEFHSVFNGLKKYPESKSELKYVLNFLAGKVLAMTNVEWVCFKIVDPLRYKILAEQNRFRGRGEEDDLNNKLSITVKSLLEKNIPSGNTLVWSWSEEGVNLKVYCILPKEMLSKEEKVFIKAVVNQLEMFYLIFSSLNPQNKRSTEWQSSNNSPLDLAIDEALAS